MTSHELVLHTNTQTLMSSTFLILLPLQMGPIIYLGATEDAALSALAILPPRPTTGATLPPRPTIGPWKTLYRKRLCVISYSRESSCSCLCYTILQKVKSELIIIDIFMRCCTYHWRRWHRGAGNRHRAPVLGTQLGKRALGGIGPLLGVLKLMLYLAVLGKVDSGDLLLQKPNNNSFIKSRGTINWFMQRKVVRNILRYVQPLRLVSCMSWSYSAVFQWVPAVSRGSCGLRQLGRPVPSYGDRPCACSSGSRRVFSVRCQVLLQVLLPK